ncbi:hypothetical protein BBJ28_00003329 [Nothophytophthora sp. Chile5]|nr:hypothetical protein BBJ28_00003329 [Nothophytophthora sp. Chile5]
MKVIGASSLLLLTQSSVASAALYDSVFRSNMVQEYPCNRWRPPRNASAWNSTRDAADYGTICPSVLTNTGDYNLSEDCLDLNIWSAAASVDAKLPVMIWSTPAISTARDAFLDGGGMAAQNVVYVNYNRRDGVFGFVAHPELSGEMLTEVGVHASGNWGILDQFAALQSGIRYPYDPLCSTLAENYVALATAEATGESAVVSFSVSSIAELREVDMDTLVFAMASFHSVLDGTTYLETLQSGPSNDVPLITGNTND